MSVTARSQSPHRTIGSNGISASASTAVTSEDEFEERFLIVKLAATGSSVIGLRNNDNKSSYQSGCRDDSCGIRGGWCITRL